MNILVLCTGNSARSILLETILAHHGASRGIHAYSAGSHPTGAVNPGAIRFLSQMGYDLTHARSKSWDEFAQPDAPLMDVVITVCDNAAGETCPLWPSQNGTQPLRHHFGIPDPAHVPEDELIPAFRTAYMRLMDFATKFLTLDLENLSREDLRSAISAIHPNLECGN